MTTAHQTGATVFGKGAEDAARKDARLVQELNPFATVTTVQLGENEWAVFIADQEEE